MTRDPAVQVRTAFQVEKYLSPAQDMATTVIPSHIRQLYEPSCNVHEVARELRQQLTSLLNEEKELTKNEYVTVKEELH